MWYLAVSIIYVTKTVTMRLNIKLIISDIYTYETKIVFMNYILSRNSYERV